MHITKLAALFIALTLAGQTSHAADKLRVLDKGTDGNQRNYLGGTDPEYPGGDAAGRSAAAERRNAQGGYQYNQSTGHQGLYTA